MSENEQALADADTAMRLYAGPIATQAHGSAAPEAVSLAAHVRRLVAEVADAEKRCEAKDAAIHTSNACVKPLLAERDQLRARIAELEAALKPFADMASAIASTTDDAWPLTDELDRAVSWPETEVKCGHVRRAAELLKRSE
jgi:phage shock protein A